MKLSSIQTKELVILEGLMAGSDKDTRRYLKNMHENFVVPYVDYLNGVGRRLDEAELTPDQITQLFGTVTQQAQAAGGNETSLGKLMPDSIKQKFADSLPPPDAGEVPGFEQKATAAAQQVQDPAAKQSLMQLIKQGLQNPATQKLIIAGVQGIAGVAAGALTGGMGGKLGATAAGAITGGLVGLVAAKLQGQDWKSAAKAGLKGAAVGGAGGLVGSVASSLAGQALDSATGGDAPASTDNPKASSGQGQANGDDATTQKRGDSGWDKMSKTPTNPDGSPMTVDQVNAIKAQQRYGNTHDMSNLAGGTTANPADAGKTGADFAGTRDAKGTAPYATGSTDWAADRAAGNIPDLPVDQATGPTAGGVPVGSTAPGINRLTGKPIAEPTSWDNMTPDQQSATVAKQQQQAADAEQGTQNAKDYWANKPANTRSLRRESIDRDLTVRMWALNESLGKPRGGVHLSEAGVGDMIKGVGNWLKTKGQNLMQTVTADKLQQAWEKAGKPTDSDKVAELLQKQGVTPDIVAGVYKTMGIPQAAAGGAEKVEPTMAPEPAAAPETPAQQTPAQQAPAEPAEPAAPAASTEPAQAQPEAPAQQQPAAQAGGSGVFADPKKLAASFESFMSADGRLPPQLRGVLKDILLTALRTVENRQRKLNNIIRESKKIEKQIVAIKKRK